MIVQIVLSISTGLFTAIALAALYVIRREVDDVRLTSHRLHKQAAQHELILEEVAALSKRQAKLAGRFYRELRDDPDPNPTAALPHPDDQFPFCENFARAQRDGPNSAAAGCECAYCQAMRLHRHNVKAALVPKSQADRISAMRRGLEQP